MDTQHNSLQAHEQCSLDTCTSHSPPPLFSYKKKKRLKEAASKDTPAFATLYFLSLEQNG
jgi:hypothetical protein